jgi:hypothetical protein
MKDSFLGTRSFDDGQSRKRLLKLLTILAFTAIAVGAQVIRKEWSPQEVVDQVWRLATEGELLTPKGWDKTVRGFFVYPRPALGDKVALIPPRGANVIQVVSNDWGVTSCTTQGTTAKVVVEYYDAGTIDSMLRYTRGKEPPPIGKSESSFTLVFAPGHWETYRSDGTTLEVSEVKASPSAWRIESPQGPPWTTVNTAIRYVLEAREKTQDPTVKKNADRTLTELLRFHQD